jgi:phosphatidylethanolamine/phosphatidyl-N-methylethanolamine N-methyltransferase
MRESVAHRQPYRRKREALMSARERVFDEARFFGRWLRSPLTMGAVTPSSRLLGRTMAGFVPDPAGFRDDSCVVELGPGTGVVTQCLIERGVPESRLVCVEYSPDFCRLLAERFPAARIVEGDAYAHGAALEALTGGRRIEAVVSSLPLFTRPDAQREALLGAALSALPADRPFIQFSYALTLPVKPERLDAQVRLSPWIKLNLPPARVIVYRRPTP